MTHTLIQPMEKRVVGAAMGFSCPSQGGDSGEVVAEGCQLGVAHPPGYPLQTILIHLVTGDVFQSLGTPAVRANLLSACAWPAGS